MHRAKRALSRRLALWTVAFTLGGAMALAQELLAHPSPVAASTSH
jgi:hypothetical protein